MALGPSLLALADACEVMAHAVGQEAALSVLSYEEVTESMDALIASLPSQDTAVAPPSRSSMSSALAVIGEVPARDVPHGDATRERRQGLFALATEEGWRDAACEVVQVP